MTYAYIRVSSDRQTTKNQYFEISSYAENRGMKIDEWVDETVSSRKALGDNINSKVLAFAFGLSAEIERNLISQRTKEALARRKADGLPLGRPKGSSAKRLKLSGKEELIERYISAGMSKSEISRRLNVCSRTLSIFLGRSAAPEKPL